MKRIVFFLVLAAVTLLAEQTAQAATNDRGRNKQLVNKIVVLADDILLPGELTDPQDTFAQVLAERLRRKYNISLEVKIVGQAGGTTVSSLALVPQVLAETPQLVMVALGYNDALAKNDPDVIYNNIDSLLKELERVGAYVMVVGVEAPVWMDHAYTSRFNNVFPRVVQRYRVLYHNGFLTGVQGDPTLTYEDRYHPNRLGIERIVNNIVPNLSEVMKNIKRQNVCKRRPNAAGCKKLFPNAAPEQ